MFLRGLIAFVLLSTFARADAAYDSALALRRAHRLPEARDAFEKLVASDPLNAAAWHQLGLLWRARGDDEAYAKAVTCLEKASELDPRNAGFLADYGGTSLQLAQRTYSISAVTKGRTAMEKAVELAPDDLDAREGLFQFYTQAPFFVGGSSKKAAAELEEIRRRDPDRATSLEVITKTIAKDFAGAFALCDAELAKNPDNYLALYEYGRTASASGQHLPEGLAHLQRALELTPSSPASPQYTHAWFRIGDIQEKLGHPAEAKQAYETALTLDPGNRPASSALARLK